MNNTGKYSNLHGAQCLSGAYARSGEALGCPMPSWLVMRTSSRILKSSIDSTKAHGCEFETNFRQVLLLSLKINQEADSTFALSLTFLLKVSKDL